MSFISGSSYIFTSHDVIQQSADIYLSRFTLSGVDIPQNNDIGHIIEWAGGTYWMDYVFGGQGSAGVWQVRSMTPTPQINQDSLTYVSTASLNQILSIYDADDGGSKGIITVHASSSLNLNTYNKIRFGNENSYEECRILGHLDRAPSTWGHGEGDGGEVVTEIQVDQNFNFPEDMTGLLFGTDINIIENNLENESDYTIVAQSTVFTKQGDVETNLHVKVPQNTQTAFWSGKRIGFSFENSLPVLDAVEQGDVEPGVSVHNVILNGQFDLPTSVLVGFKFSNFSSLKIYLDQEEEVVVQLEGGGDGGGGDGGGDGGSDVGGGGGGEQPSPNARIKSFDPQTNEIVLEETQDGGQTWQDLQIATNYVILAFDANGNPTFEIVLGSVAQDGVTGTIGEVYDDSPSGTVSPPYSFSVGGDVFVFVPPPNARIKSFDPQTNEIVLEQTQDGGQTWQDLQIATYYGIRTFDANGNIEYIITLSSVGPDHVTGTVGSVGGMEGPVSPPYSFTVGDLVLVFHNLGGGGGGGGGPDENGGVVSLYYFGGMYDSTGETADSVGTLETQDGLYFIRVVDANGDPVTGLPVGGSFTSQYVLEDPEAEVPVEAVAVLGSETETAGIYQLTSGGQAWWRADVDDFIYEVGDPEGEQFPDPLVYIAPNAGDGGVFKPSLPSVAKIGKPAGVAKIGKPEGVAKVGKPAGAAKVVKG